MSASYYPTRKCMSEMRRRCVSVSTEGSIGTGIIVETGLVFTSLHVVPGEDDIYVDDKKAELINLGPDASALVLREDVLALKVEGMGYFSPLVFNKFHRWNQGVVCFHAKGVWARESEFGKVAERTIPDQEVWMKCREGYSGSAVYNLRGELLGMLDSVRKDTKLENGDYLTAYIIPSSFLKDFYQEVKKDFP